MQWFASFAMRGLQQATLLAVVTALLSMLIPPFSHLSGGVVGLVTLRMGYRRGLGVMLLATLVMAVGLLVLGLHPGAALIYLMVIWLPVLLLAERLRLRTDYSACVVHGGLIGASLLVAGYLLLGEPATWWREHLTAVLTQVMAPGNGHDPAEIAAVLAPIMTGVVAAAIAFGAVLTLTLARWWQALLYNPGGFRAEFHSLRLGRRVQWVALVLLALSFAGGGIAAFTVQLLVVLMPLFMLQGLAVSHALVARREAHVAWLFALYALLIAAMPQTSVTLAVAGFIDNWLDLRALGKRPD